MAIKRERDEGIAIAKAWGIILVVMGHCSFSAIQPGWQKSVHDFIYLFHIPLFFFLSGYFFKWKYLGDKRTFLKKRIISLWWPYFKWVVLFTLLHNLLWTVGLYGPNVTTGSPAPGKYSLTDILIRIFGIFVFSTIEPQILGGFWFIPELFFAEVYCLLSLFLLDVFITDSNSMLRVSLLEGTKTRGRIVIIAISLFLLLAIAMKFGNLDIGVYILHPTLSSRTCLAAAFFLTGYWVHQNETKLIVNNTFFIAVSLLVILIASRLHPISLTVIINKGGWFDILFLWGVGCLGTWCVVIISRWIAASKFEPVKILLGYIGDNTLTILALHFLCFKLVNLLKVKFYNLDTVFGTYPVIIDDPSANGFLWWFLYVLVGVLFPIGIKYLYDLSMKNVLTIRSK